MSRRITLRIDGVGSMSFIAPDAMLSGLGDVEGLTASVQDFAISRRGLEFVLPGAQAHRSFHYTPAGIRDLKWAPFFDGFGLPTTARFKDLDVPVSYVGAVAAALCGAWTDSYKAALQAPKARGRPKRMQNWNQDREELFALILQRQREHGENVVDSIDSASKLDAKRFRRAFSGRTTEAKLASARQYFYSKKRDSG